MTRYSDFYNVIDDITAHLRKDFIGPIEETEVLEMEEPLSRYPLGILYAQQINQSSEIVDKNTSMEEMFEDELESDEKSKNSSIFKPSTIGISFVCTPNDEISVSFDYAVYHHSEKMITNNDKEIKRHYYTREARRFSTSVKVPEHICNTVISKKEDNDITVFLHVRKINDDNSELLTVSVINKNKIGNEFQASNTKALFQCQLSIESQTGFMPLYREHTHRSLEEEKNDMLYDSVKNYSYGHGCSSAYSQNGEMIYEVRSEFIPQYRMLQMMPKLLDDSEYLAMKYWGTAERSKACDQLEKFVGQYEKWYTKLKGNDELIARYPNAAENSFKNIEKCASRLYNGVAVLRNNDNAWDSFLYMNEAMLIQRIKTKHCSDDAVSWYPFQMAYILQIIPDIVNDNSPDRDNVDLLWFPTGGGKTEAYLGLSAFAIFFRRLTGGEQNINGVTIIMR